MDNSYEEIVLDKLIYEARHSVTQQVLETASWDIMEDVRRNVATVIARRMIPGKKATETVTVVEKPRYPTWKHQLISELPKRSFRRRFLERFFRVNVLEREIVTHTFTADTGYVFPECRLVFPDELGQIRFLTDARVDSETLCALP